MKIKKDDEVIVISGKYKGVKGKVLEARPTESRVVVEGVNRHKWHIKPTQEKPGHILDREAPMHVSNVALIDPKTKKATRAGFKLENGKKVRISKKSGAEI
ncbi:MAG: 50S ribosomal protein L24 [Rickettsiales bacterium]|jgi:large subunit ribosomal protein L24|nr:50S ribosomal protein L24 [Rickettsiales bacterium]